MPDRLEQPAVLLVGHGTRSRQGTAEFLKLAELVRRAIAPTPVEPAFLELSEPTIAQGLARLVERGATRLVVMPLLLFAAGHAQRDIPAAVAAAAAGLGRPDLIVSQAEHLGCHAALVELSRQRFTETLQSRNAVPADSTALLLVGRGSHEASATAQMHEFARLRAADAPVARTDVAFIAMAQPRVEALLPKLAECGFRRVIVQPHLLFHGELFDDLTARVDEMSRKHPAQQWLTTDYLAHGLGNGGAADDLLTQAVCERLYAGGIRVVGPIGGG